MLLIDAVLIYTTDEGLSCLRGCQAVGRRVGRPLLCENRLHTSSLRPHWDQSYPRGSSEMPRLLGGPSSIVGSSQSLLIPCWPPVWVELQLQKGSCLLFQDVQFSKYFSFSALNFCLFSLLRREQKAQDEPLYKNLCLCH